MQSRFSELMNSSTFCIDVQGLSCSGWRAPQCALALALIHDFCSQIVCDKSFRVFLIQSIYEDCLHISQSFRNVIKIRCCYYSKNKAWHKITDEHSLSSLKTYKAHYVLLLLYEKIYRVCSPCARKSYFAIGTWSMFERFIYE